MEKEDIEKNNELGREEIWRRYKILLLYIFVGFPVFMIFIVPIINTIFKLKLYIPFFILYVIFAIPIGLWVENILCPHCGNKVSKSGKRYNGKCHYCGLKMLYPKKAEYSISFKPVKYTPGLGSQQNINTGETN